MRSVREGNHTVKMAIDTVEMMSVSEDRIRSRTGGLPRRITSFHMTGEGKHRVDALYEPEAMHAVFIFIFLHAVSLLEALRDKRAEVAEID